MATTDVDLPAARTAITSSATASSAADDTEAIWLRDVYRPDEPNLTPRGSRIPGIDRVVVFGIQYFIKEYLIRRFTDPNDPQYGQYLTPIEFHARYSPTQADYDAVTAFAKSHGLAVAGVHSNRLLLDVVASAGVVEQAFGIRLQRFQTPARPGVEHLVYAVTQQLLPSVMLECLGDVIKYQRGHQMCS